MSQKKNPNIVQVVLTPLCKDIIRYKSELNATSESSIGADIIREYYKDEKKIPHGFWKWREDKNKL